MPLHEGNLENRRPESREFLIRRAGALLAGGLPHCGATSATIAAVTSMKQAAASNLIVIDLISENEALKFEVAGRMANVIDELRKKNGGCMPQDLNARGFTPTEVADNWDA